MPQQYPLPLVGWPEQTFDSFVPSAEQRALLQALQEDKLWQTHWVALVGPQGCGKSHILQAWRNQEQQQLELGSQSVLHLDIFDHQPNLKRQSSIELDGQKRLFTIDLHNHECLDRANSEQLFHILNHARLYHGKVLLASRVVPNLLKTELSDLRSRFAAFHVLKLQQYDDEHLKILCIQFFSDIQLQISPALLDYILVHSPRDAKQLKHLITALAHDSLAQKKKITLMMIKQRLAELVNEAGEMNLKD